MPKQYIITYPEGTAMLEDGTQISNMEAAIVLIEQLKEGKSAAIPHPWSVKVIDLDPTPPPIQNQTNTAT